MERCRVYTLHLGLDTGLWLFGFGSENLDFVWAVKRFKLHPIAERSPYVQIGFSGSLYRRSVFFFKLMWGDNVIGESGYLTRVFWYGYESHKSCGGRDVGVGCGRFERLEEVTERRLFASYYFKRAFSIFFFSVPLHRWFWRSSTVCKVWLYSKVITE